MKSGDRYAALMGMLGGTEFDKACVFDSIGVGFEIVFCKVWRQLLLSPLCMQLYQNTGQSFLSIWVRQLEMQVRGFESHRTCAFVFTRLVKVASTEFTVLKHRCKKDKTNILYPDANKSLRSPLLKCRIASISYWTIVELQDGKSNPTDWYACDLCSQNSGMHRVCSAYTHRWR